MTPSPEAIAWAAGILEGEGFFGGSVSPKRTVFTPKVAIEMCDRDVLERVQEIFGCGTVSDGRTRSQGRRPIYNWGTSSQAEVKRIVELTWCWMSARRKEQIAVMLERMAAGRQNEVRRCQQCERDFEWGFKKGPRPSFCSRRCRARHAAGLPAVSFCQRCAAPLPPRQKKYCLSPSCRP